MIGTVLAAAGALAAGLALGIVVNVSTVRRLRRRNRELREAKRLGDAETQATVNLTTHEKAVFYRMLDDLESGRQGKRVLRVEQTKKNLIQSITRFLFVVPPMCAIIWVFWTYALATYSTVVLQQPFPAESLSIQAIITLLGVSGLKVVENIFEHNDGKLFGQSRCEDGLLAADATPVSSGGEEGGGVG